ncbi:MAG: hypothetical protein EU539_02805 [Promethearchaeota archaeon]|nr:MAG: hypothetical protein EU539_02805 [Candidatus Lokiarchaeota archaeon]
MSYFFDLLKSKAGFSRIGRLVISKEKKAHVNTPNIVIPINNILVRNFNFIEEFENHNAFSLSDINFFEKKDILDNFNKEVLYIFTHHGTLEEFSDILFKSRDEIIKKNVIVNIPFSIPTTIIDKDFALLEIKHYLDLAGKILTEFPKVNFGLTIKIFEYLELFPLYLQIITQHENIKILNLQDAFDNFSKFRKIIEIITHVKERLDNNLLLMASGKILPKFYPILVYIGIDLIDSSYLLFLSAENFYNTTEYLLPIYKIKFFSCSCAACRGKLRDLSKDKYSSEKVGLLSIHNLISAKNYMYKLLQYLNYEDFRAFVEKSSFDNINIISMLKVLDKQNFEIIKHETPIIQKNKIIECHGPISYHRPDFREFRERVLRNFEPEPFTKLIILFPCSAKKPYSKSKSHRKYLKVLRRFPEFPDFQEIILTSPLGSIPRQLEDVYPVNSYDISVTGEWSSEELEISSEMLVGLLKKYNSDIPIICHLEGDYVEIVKKAINKLNHKFYFSEIHDKTTSKESLASLGSLIKNYKDAYSPLPKLPKYPSLKTLNRKFIKILDYQFGLGTAKKVFRNEIRVQKNRRSTKFSISDESTGEVLAIFKIKSGQILLTMEGASLLGPFENVNSNIIVFDGDKIRGTTLFRPGITDYSSDLIPGNIVVITNRERKVVIGVGILFVGSNFIKNSKHGRVVDLYERA